MNAINQLQTILLFIFITSSFHIFGQQDSSFLVNPSFEGEPRIGMYYTVRDQFFVLDAWTDCGKKQFPNESRPDIFSWEDISNINASDGETYLGLVTRNNESWEAVSQELKTALEAGRCYSFSIDLAMASPYRRQSRISQNDSPEFRYDNPLVLQIWGGTNSCEPFQLLYQSPAVKHTQWDTYEVLLKPKSMITSITLRAYYKDGCDPYNGNILIDNISNFQKTECLD